MCESGRSAAEVAAEVTEEMREAGAEVLLTRFDLRILDPETIAAMVFRAMVRVSPQRDSLPREG